MSSSVYPRVGFYQVIVWDDNNFQEFIVGKGGSCSCGGRNCKEARCEHIRMVEEHIVSGGARAAETPAIKPHTVKLPPQCPICEGAITLDRPHRAREWFWTCENSVAHYWMWRGGKAVKAFLTDRGHPNKLGAFYKKPFKEVTIVCLLILLALLRL